MVKRWSGRDAHIGPKALASRSLGGERWARVRRMRYAVKATAANVVKPFPAAVRPRPPSPRSPGFHTCATKPHTGPSKGSARTWALVEAFVLTPRDISGHGRLRLTLSSGAAVRNAIIRETLVGNQPDEKRSAERHLHLSISTSEQIYIWPP